MRFGRTKGEIRVEKGDFLGWFGGVLRGLDLVWESATQPNHIWEKSPNPLGGFGCHYQSICFHWICHPFSLEIFIWNIEVRWGETKWGHWADRGAGAKISVYPLSGSSICPSGLQTWNLPNLVSLDWKLFSLAVILTQWLDCSFDGFWLWVLYSSSQTRPYMSKIAPIINCQNTLLLYIHHELPHTQICVCQII